MRKTIQLLVIIGLALLLIGAAGGRKVGYRSEWRAIPAGSSVTFDHRLGVLPMDIDVWCSLAWQETTIPCYETGQVHIWNVTSEIMIVQNDGPGQAMVRVQAVP